MTDTQESLRIYIAVDPTKVARCKWCGRTEAEGWLGSHAGIYCSNECSLAEYANRTLLGFLIMIIVFPVLILRVPMNLYDFALGSVISMVLFSPLLCFSAAGWNQRKRTPKDSQRDDVSIELTMLRALSSAVLCPRCDANIDVTRVDEDRVYTCDYCGASGTIEVVQTG